MTCTIVLGCYRSGTSAVAGVLHHLGIPMGERFQEPNSRNPHGYYEDLDFMECHVQMREELDVSRKYQALIRRRETDHTDWGVKDPRLCYLLPEFLKILSVDNRVIVVNRSSDSICESMARAVYNGTEPKRLMPLVKDVLESRAKCLKEYDGPILEVEFLDLMCETEKQVRRIAKFVSRPFADNAAKSINRI